jgi:carbamoyltransferase
MNILGLSGQNSNAAAALVRDGVVLAAIEEEKLARIRHIGMDYAGGLPERAVRFCLDKAGIGFKDIDYVAYYIEPQKLFHREIGFYSALAMDRPDPSSLESFPNYFVDSLNALRQRLRTRALIESRLSGRGKFLEINHQLAHGASSFYVSGFETAAIAALNNRGDMISTALMTGERGRLHIKAEGQFPHSLGMVYGAVTAALGFGAIDDWHKTMWLSATGEPKLVDVFEDIIGIDSNGLPQVNLEYFDISVRYNPPLTDFFYQKTGLKPRLKDDPITEGHRTIASSLQRRLEDTLCEVAIRLRQETGEQNLCLAGGVALNSLANSAIERRAGFKRIFIQPATGNAGCSIGAALYVWHEVLANEEREYQMHHAFLGPQYDEEEIKRVLDNCKLGYEYFLTEDKLVAEVAKLIEQGRIVGWFRGAMEFGPRTLGARSILASPTSEITRDNLNIYIKQRENFRPFSAAVPQERVSEFFEPSDLTPFLQGASKVKEGKQTLIPAAVFGDRLVRVQSVNRKSNPAFWKLLTKFGELAGVPVLLNTSFNLFGEPVVSTPREAVRGFYCSGIDCLAIGNFLIKK